MEDGRLVTGDVAAEKAFESLFDLAFLVLSLLAVISVLSLCDLPTLGATDGALEDALSEKSSFTSETASSSSLRDPFSLNTIDAGPLFRISEWTLPRRLCTLTIWSGPNNSEKSVS